MVTHAGKMDATPKPAGGERPAITVTLSCTKRVLAGPPSRRVKAVAGMFGLRLDRDVRRTILPRTRLTLRGGEVTYITGPSGGGKSTLLCAIADKAARRPHVRIIDVNALPELDDRPVIDALSAAIDGACDCPTPDRDPKLGPALSRLVDRRLVYAMQLLSLAGLAEPMAWLRRPRELSDGQRFRLRMAQMMAAAHAAWRDARVSERVSPLVVALVDEFAAPLDERTAQHLAYRLGRWCRQTTWMSLIVATTRSDVGAALGARKIVEV